MVLSEHLIFNLPVSIEQVPTGKGRNVDNVKKRFQLVYQYVRQHACTERRQKTGYDQKGIHGVSFGGGSCMALHPFRPILHTLGTRMYLHHSPHKAADPAVGIKGLTVM